MPNVISACPGFFRMDRIRMVRFLPVPIETSPGSGMQNMPLHELHLLDLRLIGGVNQNG